MFLALGWTVFIIQARRSWAQRSWGADSTVRCSLSRVSEGDVEGKPTTGSFLPSTVQKARFMQVNGA